LEPIIGRAATADYLRRDIRGAGHRLRTRCDRR